MASPSIVDFHDIEQKMHAYLNAYGDLNQNQMVEDAFDSLFHDDFTYTIDRGRYTDKHKMRSILNIIFLSTGIKAHLTMFRPLDNDSFEMKLRIVNRLVDLHAHSRGWVQDGKIIRMEEYDSKQACAFWQKIVGLAEVVQNFAYFIELQNDSGISLDGVGDAFDRLFYNDVAAAIGRIQLSSRGMATASDEIDVFSEAQFTFERFQVLDMTHIEVEVHRVDRDLTNDVWHDVLTVRDAAVVAIEPYDDFKRASSNRGDSGRQNSLMAFGLQGPILLLMLSHF